MKDQDGQNINTYYHNFIHYKFVELCVIVLPEEEARLIYLMQWSITLFVA